MKKAYVLMCVYWEYNDEYNHKVGDDSGRPMTVFNDEQAADTALEQYENDAWQRNVAGENIGEWLPETSFEDCSPLMECEAIKKLSEVFPDFDANVNLTRWTLPSKLSSAQIKVLREVYPTIFFYHIVVTTVN